MASPFVLPYDPEYSEGKTMKCTAIPRSCFLVVLLLAGISAKFSHAADVVFSGELRQWHKVTLTLDGPQASEERNSESVSRLSYAGDVSSPRDRTHLQRARLLRRRRRCGEHVGNCRETSGEPTFHRITSASGPTSSLSGRAKRCDFRCPRRGRRRGRSGRPARHVRNRRDRTRAVATCEARDG